jgi:hypothetical protein
MRDIRHHLPRAFGLFGRDPLRWVGALVACAVAGAFGLFSTGEAAAAMPTKTSFHLSGSVNGTLSEANNPCDEVGTYGGEFEFSTKLSGSSNNEWTVNVNNLGKESKKGGTFKKLSGLLGNGVSIVLNGGNGKTSYYWASKSGTLTVSATGGNVSVLLVPDQSFVGKPGKGTIHLTGSWGCQS